MAVLLVEDRWALHLWKQSIWNVLQCSTWISHVRSRIANSSSWGHSGQARVTPWCLWGPCVFQVLEIERISESSARHLILAGFSLIIPLECQGATPPITIRRSAAVQATNRSNRQQLAFRNWLQVCSKGSCGDYTQPNLVRALSDGSALGHCIVRAPRYFSVKCAGVVFDKEEWIWGGWCELIISGFLKVGMMKTHM